MWIKFFIHNNQKNHESKNHKTSNQNNILPTWLQYGNDPILNFNKSKRHPRAAFADVDGWWPAYLKPPLMVSGVEGWVQSLKLPPEPRYPSGEEPAARGHRIRSSSSINPEINLEMSMTGRRGVKSIVLEAFGWAGRPSCLRDVVDSSW